MSTAALGIRLHRLLYTFEALSKELQDRGVRKAAADHWSLVAALRLEGFPQEEAEAFASKQLRK